MKYKKYIIYVSDFFSNILKELLKNKQLYYKIHIII
nr:MAG TPA: hypothetical protein [Caudoviricetes sp.]